MQRLVTASRCDCVAQQVLLLVCLPLLHYFDTYCGTIEAITMSRSS